jgi:hypothetical protein
MSASPAPFPAALARMERALLSRRFAALDLRLRLELLAFAVLAAGFFGWQVRIPLDGLARHRGATAAVLAVATGLALSLIAGALIAAARQRASFRERSGPAWLALPLAPAAIATHLARVSAPWALWALIPGAGVLVAGAGLIPNAIHVVLAIAFLALLLPAGRLGATLATAWRPPPGAGPAIERWLRVAARTTGRARTHRARWGRGPAWLVLWAKDLSSSLRPGPLRGRLVPALLLALASALAWRLPGDPRLAGFLAFAVALLAAAAFAEWIVELCGSDPFAVLRALPVGPGALWGARFASALLAALLLAGAHAAVRATATPDPWTPALRLQLVSTGLATLLVCTLGANYGLTLFPRSDHAARMLAVTLGLSIAASLMIPLMGWVILLAGWIHSARRLPRWFALEEA